MNRHATEIGVIRFNCLLPEFHATKTATNLPFFLLGAHQHYLSLLAIVRLGNVCSLGLANRKAPHCVIHEIILIIT
ncbi:hypothetical protein MT325_m689L [Paramecium bursaria chlorella virus MT325]|uniref:Uncharacterized protein m689L n=1 Tax=Paramecium bursaria Chlorella virus MT325 TaxID=346932 RepID=A7IV69_PBCVM|nr:hypothetical protein MT325_m689L [Paramecium bursaria chlorella virus MT325]